MGRGLRRASGGTRREGSHSKKCGSIGPASQTLIVPSPEPETILVPSGECATELITLCAFSLVALSSRVAAMHAEEASVQAKELAFWAPKRACIPDVDRA